MEFHLVYTGDLLKAAGRQSSRVSEKHGIRRYLHNQIKMLWETHPALLYYGNKTVEKDNDGNERPFLDALAHNYSRAGKGYIPLITEPNGLACSLDILFLRPDQPGSIVNSAGDIDNRMKVLIDALQIPKDESQIKTARDEEPDPDPMYCLLEDDKLITGLRVKTDRLLSPTTNAPSEVWLVIRVETSNIDPFGSPYELHL